MVLPGKLKYLAPFYFLVKKASNTIFSPKLLHELQ